MKKTISIETIKKIDPDYSYLSNVVTDETEELTIKQWIEKYRKVIHATDIIWLIVRREFMSEKDLRLFSVWCAREALKLIEDPDYRSISACDVAERYANGEATKEELNTAHAYAIASYHDVNHYAYSDECDIYDYYDTVHAAYVATYAAVYASDIEADYHAATYVIDDYHVGDSHIDKLLTYFE